MVLLTTENEGGSGVALVSCPRLGLTDADGACSSDTRGLKGDVGSSLLKMGKDDCGVHGSGTFDKHGASVSSASAARGATASANCGKLDGRS